MAITGFKYWNFGGITTLNFPSSTNCDIWNFGGVATYYYASINANITASIANITLSMYTPSILAKSINELAPYSCVLTIINASCDITIIEAQNEITVYDATCNITIL